MKHKNPSFPKFEIKDCLVIFPKVDYCSQLEPKQEKEYIHKMKLWIFSLRKKIIKAYFQAGKIVHWLEHLPDSFEDLSSVSQNQHRAQYSATLQVVLWSLNAHCHALSNCGLIKLFLWRCLTQVYSLQIGIPCYIKVQILLQSNLMNQWLLLGLLTGRSVGFLHEKKWRKDSYITKAHLSMGSSSQNLEKL